MAEASMSPSQFLHDCPTFVANIIISQKWNVPCYAAARLALRERLFEHVAECERVDEVVRLRVRVLVGEGRGAA